MSKRFLSWKEADWKQSPFNVQRTALYENYGTQEEWCFSVPIVSTEFQDYVARLVEDGMWSYSGDPYGNLYKVYLSHERRTLEINFTVVRLPAAPPATPAAPDSP
jgi:hypothetical protein